jgi:hypothetical protein
VKIEGFTHQEHPFVKAGFLCRGLKLPSIDIKFLIDTGATCTTILEDDAKRLNPDFEKLEKAKYPSQILGGKMYPYVLPESLLIFETTEKYKKGQRKFHVEPLDEVEIIRPKGDSDEPDFSILGTDIIRRFDFSWKRNGKPTFTREKPDRKQGSVHTVCGNLPGLYTKHNLKRMNEEKDKRRLTRQKERKNDEPSKK